MKMIGFILIVLANLQAQVRPLPTPQIDINPRIYQAAKTTQPLVIDGAITENAWRKANWTKEFVDIRGEKFPQPKYRTRVKMLWNSQYLFVAAELEEPHVWGTLNQHDAIIYYDNDFEIFIDPDGDTHNYFEIEINALNTVWDLFLDKPYRDGAHPLNGWDIHGLQTAVRVNGTLNNPADVDSGWTVEMAIPWPAFQFKSNQPAVPRDGDIWRINFSRVQWKTHAVHGKYVKQTDAAGKTLREDNWVWSPQGLVAMHYPEMWGMVQFSDGSKKFDESRFANAEQRRVIRLLWQVYYREKNFFRKNGRYALWSELDIGHPSWMKNEPAPLISITPSLWEARLPDPAGEGDWCVRFDGLVWKEPDRK